MNEFTTRWPVLKTTRQAGRITTVTVTKDGFTGLGRATCSKTDVYSAEIGEQIALGRALIDLGLAVEVAGNARTVTKDELRRVRAIEREGSAGLR